MKQKTSSSRGDAILMREEALLRGEKKEDSMMEGGRDKLVLDSLLSEAVPRKKRWSITLGGRKEKGHLTLRERSIEKRLFKRDEMMSIKEKVCQTKPKGGNFSLLKGGKLFLEVRNGSQQRKRSTNKSPLCDLQRKSSCRRHVFNYLTSRERIFLGGWKGACNLYRGVFP